MMLVWINNWSLRKHEELLCLQKRIAELQEGLLSGNRLQLYAPTTATISNRLTFRDIEHTIGKFDGENRSYDVRDFLRNFERKMQMIAADNIFKFTSLCNSLTGTAKLLLNKDAMNYETLKELLIKEFGRLIGRNEVYRMLTNRKWNKKDETIRRYVLEMESIADRCDHIDELELISFILDGMQDNSQESHLLISARTMEQFKDALNLYELRKANRMSAEIELNGTKLKGNAWKPKYVKNDGMVLNIDTSEIRCFNCTRKGHYQSKCPYEKRPMNACFKCWKPGHGHRNCPNPKKILECKKIIAAIDSDVVDDQRNYFHDDGDKDFYPQTFLETINAVNLVSVAFSDNQIGCNNFLNVLSLFDTGSPINLVRKSVVPFEINTVPIESNKYRGLGGKILEYGTVKCIIKFKNRCNRITLIVIPDEMMSVP